MKQKVLTIRNPWATLIVDGYKKYEFRSWQTKYRGKILIHAGLNNEKKYLNRFSDYHLEYINGAIIGEAILTDCIKVTNDFQNDLIRINPVVYGKSDHADKYAWKLESIVKYKKPIYIKGKLGLWSYDDNKD